MTEHSQEREVYYHLWCPKCEHWNLKGDDDPCDECLNQPYNIDSHKPINYKEKV